MAPVTVTTALPVPALPAASVAVNTTVVSPIGRVSGALLVTATVPSTASVAVAPSKNAVISVAVFAAPAALVATTVIAAGTVTTGAVISVLGVGVGVGVGSGVTTGAVPELLSQAAKKQVKATTR